jgi:hypothetical protein
MINSGYECELLDYLGHCIIRSPSAVPEGADWGSESHRSNLNPAHSNPISGKRYEARLKGRMVAWPLALC